MQYLVYLLKTYSITLIPCTNVCGFTGCAFRNSLVLSILQTGSTLGTNSRGVCWGTCLTLSEFVQNVFLHQLGFCQRHLSHSGAPYCVALVQLQTIHVWNELLLPRTVFMKHRVYLAQVCLIL